MFLVDGTPMTISRVRARGGVVEMKDLSFFSLKSVVFHMVSELIGSSFIYRYIDPVPDTLLKTSLVCLAKVWNECLCFSGNVHAFLLCHMNQHGGGGGGGRALERGPQLPLETNTANLITYQELS